VSHARQEFFEYVQHARDDARDDARDVRADAVALYREAFMSFLRSALLVLLCVVSLGATTSALGDEIMFDPTVTRPTGRSLNVGDWSFVAVVQRGSNGSAGVVGVLALLDKDAAVGENIVSVWYERPASANSEWPSMAWSETDQWSAIKWVKDTYGIADDFDGFWPTKDTDTSAAVKSPEDYVKGILTNDPLFAVVDSTDREAIIALLADIGYKAANISFEQSAACEAKNVLDGYATTVEFAVSTFGPGAPYWGADLWNGQNPESVVDTLLSIQIPPACLTLAQGTAPFTSPGTPVNPTRPWQRDTSPARRKASCDGVGSCCYESTIIHLYYGGWRNKIRYCKSYIEFSCPDDGNGGCPATPSCGEPTPGPAGHVPPAGAPTNSDCGHVLE